MTAGDSAQFSAQTLDAKGNPLNGRAVAWSTSDKKIATVSATGLVQAIKASPSVMIKATSEGVDGMTTLKIMAPPPPPPPPPPSPNVGPARATGLSVRPAALPRRA